jgi:hypothetical protein
MNKRITITEELNRIAPGCNWPSVVPFAVPEGYFEALSSTILFHIKLQESHNQPFTVPGNYFEHLPAIILQKIKENAEVDPVTEIEELAPVLAGIPKGMPYTVPATYFDSLTVPKPTTPIRLLSKRSWIRWAVAASVTLLAGSSALIFIHRSPSVEKQLERFNEEEIVSYLQNHIDPLENEAFLSEVSVPIEDAAFIQDQLQNAIPSEALEQYLKQTEFSKEVLPDNK